MLVELTPYAREVSAELFGPLAAAAGPLLERYSDEQLVMLIEFAELGRRIQDRHAEWLRTQAPLRPPPAS